MSRFHFGDYTDYYDKYPKFVGRKTVFAKSRRVRKGRMMNSSTALYDRTVGTVKCIIVSTVAQLHNTACEKGMANEIMRFFPQRTVDLYLQQALGLLRAKPKM